MDFNYLGIVKGILVAYFSDVRQLIFGEGLIFILLSFFFLNSPSITREVR